MPCSVHAENSIYCCIFFYLWDVGSYSMCPRYTFPMGTFAWKVSQILDTLAIVSKKAITSCLFWKFHQCSSWKLKGFLCQFSWTLAEVHGLICQGIEVVHNNAIYRTIFGAISQENVWGNLSWNLKDSNMPVERKYTGSPLHVIKQLLDVIACNYFWLITKYFSISQEIILESRQ